MSSGSQALLRTKATSVIGSRYVDNDDSPHIPLAPAVAAPHLVEHLEISPSTGDIQPNGRPVFEFPLDADVLKTVNLRMRLHSLAPNGGTFIRYVDYIGLSCWSEARLKYGTERFKYIRYFAVNIFQDLRLDSLGSRWSVLSMTDEQHHALDHRGDHYRAFVAHLVRHLRA